jgi:hypothetical protein
MFQTNIHFPLQSWSGNYARNLQVFHYIFRTIRPSSCVKTVVVCNLLCWFGIISCVVPCTCWCITLGHCLWVLLVCHYDWLSFIILFIIRVVILCKICHWWYFTKVCCHVSLYIKKIQQQDCFTQHENSKFINSIWPEEGLPKENIHKPKQIVITTEFQI